MGGFSRLKSVAIGDVFTCALSRDLNDGFK